MKNVYIVSLIVSLIFSSIVPFASAEVENTEDASSVLGGKLFLMGGMTSNGQALNDVYSSTDAATWTTVLANAPWTGRVQAEAVYFQDKIWVMGGFTSSNTYSDEIWNSPNGVDWTLVKVGPHWSPRTKFSLVVFQNKMWVMGGRSSTQVYNDIWNTTDGINWTQVQPTTRIWEPRQQLGGVVFNPGTGNRIYVIGGAQFSGGMPYNDVWSTGNGISWRREKDHALNNPPVNIENPVVYRDHGVDKIYLLGCVLGGGVQGCVENVWSSTNGVNWTLGAVAPWGNVSNVTPVVFNNGNGNKIYTTGGITVGTFLSSIWKFNGSNWNQVTTTPTWTPRMGHLVVKVPATFGL